MGVAGYWSRTEPSEFSRARSGRGRYGHFSAASSRSVTPIPEGP